jgi:hypothetical protein
LEGGENRKDKTRNVQSIVRVIRDAIDGVPIFKPKEEAMLFVMFMGWRPGVTREQSDEALARRAQWQYPEGVNVLGEYWTSSPAAAVVSIAEADDYESLMEINLTWGDVFTISAFPATTAEEGLEMGARIMQRRDAT